MTRPRISVVIPAYNSGNFIENVLNSIEKQKFRDFELIVVDDCSTDNTWTLLQDFSEGSSVNVRLIKNEINRGPAASRNFGIKSADGEIIALTDSDCILRDNWLGMIDGEFKDPSIDIVMGKVTIPKSTFLGDSIAALGFPAGGSLGFENMWQVSKDGFTIQIVTCNCALRGDIFKKAGFFDETFPSQFGEDTEFSQRLLRNGIKIKYSPNVVIIHQPRTSVISFFKWALNRGRGRYYLKKKVNMKNFTRLRLWSTMNMIKKYYKDIKFPLIMLLFLLLVVLQELGYYGEIIRIKVKRIRKE